MKSKNCEARALDSDLEFQAFNEIEIRRRNPLADGPASPVWETILRLIALGLALLCLAGTTLHAGGLVFPDNLPKPGDHAVLGAPLLDFARKLSG